MRAFTIKPVDTWFFRDGTPFAIDAGPQVDVGGSFPPSPSTVAGAMRAALASAHGWDGVGAWPGEFNKTLGDGPDDLGVLKVLGPFLVKEGGVWLPVPGHVYSSKESPSGLAAPREEAVVTDMGKGKLLPDLPPGTKLSTRQWVEQCTFEQILTGSPPEKSDLVDEKCFWLEEPRTGIQRDAATRTVSEGMLYSSRHIRTSEKTHLMELVDGLPREWALPAGVYPFGGEARLAEIHEVDEPLQLKMPLESICASRRFVIVALTPLDIGRDVFRGDRPIAELADARVVCACADRPVRFGGWDSLKRMPRPLRSLVAPGSVLFCETQEPERLGDAISRVSGGFGVPAIGAGTALGFGCVALGVWPGEGGQG